MNSSTDSSMVPSATLNSTGTSGASDTSNAIVSPEFFEGVEKLLEIWFTRSDRSSDEPQDHLVSVGTGSVNVVQRSSDGEEDEDKSGDEEPDEDTTSWCKDTKGANKTCNRKQPDGDLRLIPRHCLQDMLAVVKCEIISSKHSEHIDAYVLSESSMFVSKNRIIIKTCGTTILLRCIKPLLYLAKHYAGFDRVLDVFYSHKNFTRPDLQEKVHSRFDYEVELLESFFKGGSAYCFGRINSDCYYFYTLNQDNKKLSASLVGPDQTLEMIMYDLDPHVMSIFNKKSSKSAQEATIKSNIDKIFPDAVIDDFLFNPCGYSMNGLIKGMYYFTIHITPEDGFSFVSFETNFPQKNYQNLINKILKIFYPRKFTMVLFANEQSMASVNLNTFQNEVNPHFNAIDIQFARFRAYDMTYGNFVRNQSIKLVNGSTIDY